MRRLILLAPLLAGLTACNAATAISLGGESIGTRHVDEVTRSYCTVLAKLGSGTATPLSTVRSQVVSSLAARAAAEQFGAAYDVSADDSYESDVASLADQLAQFDDDTATQVIEVAGAQAYLAAVLTSVETKLQPGGDSSDTSQAQQVFTDWLGKHDIELNPVYGLDVTGGKVSSVDASVSLAVSDTATSALSGATTTLPASQSCG